MNKFLKVSAILLNALTAISYEKLHISEEVQDQVPFLLNLLQFSDNDVKVNRFSTRLNLLSCNLGKPKKGWTNPTSSFIKIC